MFQVFMKDYAFDHLRLMMYDKAATVIQAGMRAHVARRRHVRLQVRVTRYS